MSKHHRPLTLAIDFDGTIVEEAFPGLGKMKPEANKYINMLYDQGCMILINTCRTGGYEADAENFLRRMGIKYHYINCNLPQSIEYFKQDCRKLSADVYIDDTDLKIIFKNIAAPGGTKTMNVGFGFWEVQ
jgi:hydroxymethylpyrimidine pyrophosphatase-like HAD family hydrolase